MRACGIPEGIELSVTAPARELSRYKPEADRGPLSAIIVSASVVGTASPTLNTPVQ